MGIVCMPKLKRPLLCDPLLHPNMPSYQRSMYMYERVRGAAPMLLVKPKEQLKHPSAVQWVKLVLYSGMLYANENEEATATLSLMEKPYKPKHWLEKLDTKEHMWFIYMICEKGNWIDVCFWRLVTGKIQFFFCLQKKHDLLDVSLSVTAQVLFASG